MSLGIRRECIGDILLSEDGAYLFVLDTVAPLVCDELSSVGRCSVCVRAGRAEELPGLSLIHISSRCRRSWWM